MPQFKYLTLLILISISSNHLIAQKLTDNYSSENNKFKLIIADQFNLSEDEYFISEIMDLEAKEDDLIYISQKSEPGVLRFSQNGSEQIAISRFGKGPFEYGDPSIIKIHENKLYVWDSSDLSFLTFGVEGAKIDEITGFRWSKGDFAITDQSVFAYNNGRSQGKFIQEISMSSGKILSEYGQIDETHAFYKMYAPAGAIAEHDNDVFFMGPSTTKINKINTLNGELSSSEIVDKDFNNAKIMNAKDLIQNDRERTNELMRNASYVIDIFALEKYLVVQTQVGEAVYNEDANAYSLLEKKTKFHVLDYETLNVLDTFVFSTITMDRPQSRYWTTNGSELIHITSYPLNSTLLEPQGWEAYYFDIEPNSNHTQ